MFDKESIESLSENSILIIKESGSRERVYHHFYLGDISKIKAFFSSIDFPYAGEGVFRCGFNYEVFLFEDDKPDLVMKVCFSCERAYLGQSGFSTSKENFMKLVEKNCIAMVIDGKRYVETLKKYVDKELGKA